MTHDHEPAAPVPDQARERLSILILEDDPICMDLFVTRLEGMDYEVLAAVSIEEAFHLAVTRRPAMIFADLWIDGDQDGGLKLITALREEPTTRDIPLVIISAYGAQAEGMRHLVAGVLPKPTPRRALLELVERHAAPDRSSR